MKMHDDEVDIDAGLVRRLVTAQFPELARLPVRAFRSTGTVNAIYRLGERLYARLPRVERWSLETELRWLPVIAARVTMSVPEPVAIGEPTAEYPFTWAIFRWLAGRTYADSLIDNEVQAAADLARFVTELRRIEPAADAPAGGRRPLHDLDASTRAYIADAANLIDTGATTAAWEESLRYPPWDGSPVWIHGDLLPVNLLVDNGRISAVIDFGGSGIGDPATDLDPAWSAFGPAGRQVFRDALGADDGAWGRGRGIALHQAVGLIPYYVTSNPEMAALGQRTLAAILTEMGFQ